MNAALSCLDCGVNVAEIGEGFMLHDAVWLKANPESNGMLCIGCIEKRLGRELCPSDFTESPMNHPEMLKGLAPLMAQSDRLLRRLGK